VALLERRAEEAEEEAGRVGRAEDEAQEAADRRAAADTDRCARAFVRVRARVAVHERGVGCCGGCAGPRPVHLYTGPRPVHLYTGPRPVTWCAWGVREVCFNALMQRWP
jgi:hypothetical protein